MGKRQYNRHNRTIPQLCGIMLLCLLSLGACTKRKQPQLPSNKNPVADSLALAMIEINQQLVQQANDELATYVVSANLPYVYDEQGFWYMKTKQTDGLQLQKDQTISLAQRVYLLDGTLCEDLVSSIQIGKKQVPAAVEALLPTLREGESASILAPWYLAYGQYSNNKKIGAYTNVRIEIDISDL